MGIKIFADNAVNLRLFRSETRPNRQDQCDYPNWASRRRPDSAGGRVEMCAQTDRAGRLES